MYRELFFAHIPEKPTMDDDETQPFPMSLRQVFHDAVNNSNQNDTASNEEEVRMSRLAVCVFDYFFLVKTTQI